jgi:hypothetical protein
VTTGCLYSILAEIVADVLALFWELGAMDTAVRKLAQHPMPEIAAFVASLKEVFGDVSSTGLFGEEGRRTDVLRVRKWPLHWHGESDHAQRLEGRRRAM